MKWFVSQSHKYRRNVAVKSYMRKCRCVEERNQPRRMGMSLHEGQRSGTEIGGRREMRERNIKSPNHVDGKEKEKRRMLCSVGKKNVDLFVVVKLI